MNATARLDVAVALSAGTTEPKAWLPSAPNVMLCAVNVETRKVWVTGMAGAYVVLPVWLAAMEHVPTATRVMVVPETVQTGLLLEANVTDRPEVAVAASAGGVVTFKVCVGMGPNVIVCGVRFTVKICVTGLAAA